MFPCILTKGIDFTTNFLTEGNHTKLQRHMQKVNMYEAKIHLSRYVDLALAGEEILNVCE